MFYKKDMSLKYHVIATMYRTFIAYTIFSLAPEWVEYDIKSLIPWTLVIVCLFRLVYQDYASIKVRYPGISGLHWAGVAARTGLFTGAFANNMKCFTNNECPEWMRYTTIIGIFAGIFLMADAYKSTMTYQEKKDYVQVNMGMDTKDNEKSAVY